MCARERDREYVGTYVCDFANVYLERERDGGGGKTRERQTEGASRKGERGIVYVCVCVCCFVFIKPILGNRYGPVTDRCRGRKDESARKRQRVEGGREGDCVCVRERQRQGLGDCMPAYVTGIIYTCVM